MCGRFTLTWPSYAELARMLGVVPAADDALLHRPRWNVAPTDPHWVVRASGASGREMIRATWGFVPPPAASGARRGPLINARAESARRMPGVRDAFASRRCIVPVDGFYEWVGDEKARRPIWFHPSEPDLFRFAGLWEPVGDAGDAVRFTILTTAANDVVAPVHDRMPVIVAAADVDVWIGGTGDDAAALLRPAPAAWLAATAVTPRANSVKNDDPACLDPWDPTLEIDLRDAAAGAKRRGTRSKEPTLSLFGEVANGHTGRVRRPKSH